MTDAETVDGEVIEEETRNLPAVVASEALVARGEISVEDVVAQKEKISQVMQRVMVKDVHYGVIPGTGKPSLLKPGAEAILVALRLAPHYDSEKHIDGDHLTVFVKCELQHIPTKLVIATGEGMCSTKEAKYAFRTQKRECPECGSPSIIKGKKEYGGGWLCWKKADPPGCGAKFDDGDARIEGQPEGKVPNPELPDTWNTVLKMADKRALIAAVLNGTAASDVFTQDVEDKGGASGAEGDADRSADSRSGPQGGAPTIPVPKSWAEIEAAVRRADNPEEAWALFCAFRRAASYHLYGVTADDPQEDAALLDAKQWSVMGQKSAGAVVWLLENVTYEGPFLFFDEDAQRKAWAHVLDGAALEIPDYVAPEPPAPEPDLDEERAREAEAAE